MTHPWGWVSPCRQRTLFCATVTASVVFLIVLAIQGAPLRNPVAKGGIFCLQFAFNEDRARAVIESWSAIPRTARWQVQIDFGFLVVYPVAISLGCGFLAQSSRGAMANAALACSWAVLLAGPLDLVEDLASLRMLSAGRPVGLARTVGWCAAIKFLVVIPSLGLLLVAGLLKWVRGRGGSVQESAQAGG